MIACAVASMMVGQPVQGGWTVFTVWRAGIDIEPVEVGQMFPDWFTARRHALKTTCLTGVRSVTLCDPQLVVAGDFDRITGRWREYRLRIGACDNYLEQADRPCAGQLYAEPFDQQVKCPRCGGWSGARAPGMQLVYDNRADDRVDNRAERAARGGIRR
jgi:hypothetical protein